MPHEIIDTHAHLDEIENLPQVIASAKAAGLLGIIAVGQDVNSNARTLEIAAEYPGYVYPALGYHPCNIREANVEENMESIKANISKAVAVGEIGLDYHKRVREGADKDLQKRVLRELLGIAKEQNKPALIHSRYAWRDALNLVIESGVEKAVFHWFTGPTSVLRDIIDHGYYLSATPAIEYHEEHRRAVKETPLAEIYRNAPIFKSLRDTSKLEGKCGACEYKEICGGSRARAYALTGDPLAPEPCCIYQPKHWDAQLESEAAAIAASLSA